MSRQSDDDENKVAGAPPRGAVKHSQSVVHRQGTHASAAAGDNFSTRGASAQAAGTQPTAGSVQASGRKRKLTASTPPAASAHGHACRGLFSGMTFFFVNVQQQQLKLLCDAVKKNDGQVVDKLSNVTPAVTHAVAETFPTDSGLTQKLLNKTSHAVWVHPNWIGLCAAKNMLLEIAPFVISKPAESPPPPPPQQQQQPLPEPKTEVPKAGRNLACQRVLQSSGAPRRLKRLNADLVCVFKRLAELYSALPGENNSFRRATFDKFANKLDEKVDFPITNHEELDRALDILGCERNSSCAKIMLNFVSTGQCERLDALTADENIRAADELTQVWGISTVKAGRLICSGVKSIDALRARVALDDEAGQPHATLSAAQRLGLQHHEDLKQRIPRQEIEAIMGVISRELQALKTEGIVDTDGAIAQAVGSYRRGMLTSGDLDILLTHRNEEIVRDLPEPLLARLCACGLLQAKLSSTGGRKRHHLGPFDVHSFMGICRLSDKDAQDAGMPVPRPMRRIDIKAYAYPSFPFALLYFTGSGHFNRSMRWYANRIGMSLSDQALVQASGTGRNNNRAHAHKSTSVQVEDEAGIFEALGLDYVPPEQRNV